MIAEPAIYLFIWRLTDADTSSEDRILSCAGIYSEAAGIERAGDILSMSRQAIARDRKGKPFFPAAPGLHFSLSHSGGYGACAFHVRPVGFDLQLHTECRREAIARRCFHPEEYAYLAKTGFEDFFRVWTAKESYVKYTGSGIAGILDKFIVADGDGMRDAMGDAEFYRRETPDGYSMCLCAAAIPEVRIVTF